METKNQNNQEQPLVKSQTQLQKPSLLTTECLTKNLEIIHKAYPSLSEGFYEIFCERIKKHLFTDWELTRSVEHVIDTCKYPQPLIAEFISFMRPDGIIEPQPRELSPEEIEADGLREEERQRVEAEKDARNIE